jgi:hypothetical protein
MLALGAVKAAGVEEEQVEVLPLQCAQDLDHQKLILAVLLQLLLIAIQPAADVEALSLIVLVSSMLCREKEKTMMQLLA